MIYTSLHALVHKAKSDQQAFEKLYDQMHKKIYAFVAHRVESREVAEDLVSEIWIKIVRSIGTCDPQNDPQTFAWFFRIARNHVIDYYRSRKIVASEDELLHMADVRVPSPEVSSNMAVDLERVAQAMQQLSANEQECVSLKYFSDLKNTDIAEVLHMPPKTVASHLVRGLQKIRTQLEHQEHTYELV